MASLDFWYAIGSTYSYLTVMRITEAARAARVTVTWRPFNLREVMVRQDNLPFKDKPVKAAYMWRDIERRAAARGLSPRLPAAYPLEEFETANRVAVLGAREGWAPAYTLAAYRGWFEGGHPAGAEPNLSESLVAAGQDPARALREARSDTIGAALAAATEEAEAQGIFGAPSFVAAGELFWGDDRLADALAWAGEGRIGAVPAAAAD